ncbi:MAG: tetratricopeptide repeat protein [Marinobacter sp.]|nr:tetratricopeptide repeat protein [Marinobacter sp.]
MQSVSQPQQPANPQQALVHAQEGAKAYKQGDMSAAIDAWQLAVALNPRDVVTRNNLALLLKQANRFDEAAELLETGLESSPKVAELHYNLAVISELYLLDLKKALSHYKRYQSLSASEDKKVEGWIADLQRRLD